MKRSIILLIDIIRLFTKAWRPGGVRAIIAENIALRQQLIVIKRKRKRAPKLKLFHRILFACLSKLISKKRLKKIIIIIKPSTIIKFHHALIKRKYRMLFSNKKPRKSGPQGPSQELIDAIIEMKKRNQFYGYRRIAMQINIAFGCDINKDVVKRILDKYYKSTPTDGGPSWLTFIGNLKDSLWSVDLFRCESINLKSHWVMLVMDQFTRRIVDVAVRAGDLSGVDVCCMFNEIISRKALPKYLSSDNDPLFKFYQWQANLRIFEIEEIKTVPYTPISHPFVERLIGTIRREYLDKTLFWNDHDLQNKLNTFVKYYNENRGHSSVAGKTPSQKSSGHTAKIIDIKNFRWEKQARGLFQLPVSA